MSMHDEIDLLYAASEVLERRHGAYTILNKDGDSAFATAINECLLDAARIGQWYLSGPPSLNLPQEIGGWPIAIAWAVVLEDALDMGADPESEQKTMLRRVLGSLTHAVESEEQK